MGQLALSLADRERQCAEGGANATAMREARKRGGERKRGGRSERALKGGSSTTAAGSTAGEKQQRDKAAGKVLQTGPSVKPEFRREPTREALRDKLSQSSNAYRVVPWNQIGHDNDAVGESDFGARQKAVKWQISVFDGKITSWRTFEVEGLMAMQHLHLDSVLDVEKEGIPVANKMISRYRLYAHHDKSKVAKYFAL